jgi:sugar/nucleoside kinase (ribokinase family)
MMTAQSLLVVGSLAYDSIQTPGISGEELLGGSAAHFCYAAVLAGAYPRLVAVVGDDFRPQDLAALAALPVDIQGVQRRPGRTFRWGGRYSEDYCERETLYTDLGVFADFRPELPAAYRGSEVVYLGNIQPELQAQVLAANGPARFTALDTMNLWIATARDALLEVLARVDLLFTNDEEARLLTRESSLVRAGQRLLALGPAHCLVKKGEHGGLLFSGDAIYPCPSFPIPEVVDPTGAGDAFAGGVMGHLVSEGRYDTAALRRAVLTGAAAGSLAVEGLGLAGLARNDAAALLRRRAQLLDLVIPPA